MLSNSGLAETSTNLAAQETLQMLLPTLFPCNWELASVVNFTNY